MISLQTDILEMNQGSILANGGHTGGSNSVPTGAGGSIDIQVGTIRQLGQGNQIAANGGGTNIDGAYTYYPQYVGAGGRIRVGYGQNEGFEWSQVTSRSGTSLLGNSNFEYGSAGTVLIQRDLYYPDLKISNIDPLDGQTMPSDMATEMEIVGRRRIYDIQLQDGYTDRWIISTWGLSDDKDYAGYMVDLDDADDLSPHYPLVGSIGNDRLIVRTDENLAETNWMYKYLVGVHEFNAIIVEGQATADFGQDRVIVNDLGGSVWDATSSIIAGPGSVLPVQQ